VLAEAKATDEAEDERLGEERGDELPQQLRTVEGRRAFFREAKETLTGRGGDSERPETQAEASTGAQVSTEVEASTGAQVSTEVEASTEAEGSTEREVSSTVVNLTSFRWRLLERAESASMKRRLRLDLRPSGSPAGADSQAAEIAHYVGLLVIWG
jgi:hypothetical protein